MNTTPTSAPTGAVPDYDAIVIGAGVSGLYQLHLLREQGLKVKAFDAASGVGGTWYWNRYPGCRVDSQAEVYQYWFSEALYKAWQPSERFPAQPETERWLNFVADRLDLKKDIQFNTRISAAHYDETSHLWHISTEAGEHFSTRFIASCTGILSAPLTNTFEGQDQFKGEIHHTSQWPKTAVDVKGKRVAVIGTGATGIQVIQAVAPEVSELKVFIRTPPYIIKLNNPTYNDADRKRIHDQFHITKQKVLETFGGFDYNFSKKPWAETTKEERLANYEALWQDGSLAFWVGSYTEVFFDDVANLEISEFVRKKMRARLHDDPRLCKILVPDYPFGSRRVPLENKFLEIFLQPHVEAIDCRATRIERIVENGIQTSDGKVHEVDIIVLATGFDGGTGALSRIDIQGRNGVTLKSIWGKETRSTLGLQVHGFPNLFTVGGPLAPIAALCNVPTCAQQQVEWVSQCISDLRKQGKTEIEAKLDFENAWIEHHDQIANMTVIARHDSWYMGTNVKGKQRRLVSYAGGVDVYRGKCAEQTAQGYPGFETA